MSLARVGCRDEPVTHGSVVHASRSYTAQDAVDGNTKARCDLSICPCAFGEGREHGRVAVSHTRAENDCIACDTLRTRLDPNQQRYIEARWRRERARINRRFLSRDRNRGSH